MSRPTGHQRVPGPQLHNAVVAHNGHEPPAGRTPMVEARLRLSPFTRRARVRATLLLGSGGLAGAAASTELPTSTSAPNHRATIPTTPAAALLRRRAFGAVRATAETRSSASSSRSRRRSRPNRDRRHIKLLTGAGTTSVGLAAGADVVPAPAGLEVALPNRGTQTLTVEGRRP